MYDRFVWLLMCYSVLKTQFFARLFVVGENVASNRILEYPFLNNTSIHKLFLDIYVSGLIQLKKLTLSK